MSEPGASARPATPGQGRARPRIGISSCLLGVKVRFDGGDKKDRFLTRTVSRYCEWVPVCPEFEMGLGVPREAMRLEGSAEAPRLITIRTRVDHTRAIASFARRRIRELAALDLDGYIFKRGSPSCGTRGVPVTPRAGGRAVHRGVGLFAREFMARFPLVPVEEEGRLDDPGVRESFFARVLGHWRWRRLVEAGLTIERLKAFHAAERCLLLAHSPKHYRELEQELARLLAGGTRLTPARARRYGELFAGALRVRATRPKHAQVLIRLARGIGNRLSAAERAELDTQIQDFRAGRGRLAAPLRFIRRFARRAGSNVIQDQVYLNPHPIELKLTL